MEKIIIDLEAKTDKALKEIEKLNKTLSDTGKESKKSLSSIDKSAKKAAKSTSLLEKGFKGAGLALKGLGIGIVVKLVDRLSEAFSGNQKIVDAVNVAFETVSIVGKQLIDVFSDVFGKVSDATGGFDALKKVLGGALSIAVNTIVLAFQGIVLGVQKAQLAWEDSFFGDGDPKELKRLNLAITETQTKLVETGERIKNAGKDIADNFVEAVGEVGSLASGVAEAVTETIEKVDIKQAASDAKRLVNSQKNFERLAQQQQRLVEQYDLQAERLRQVRDDESKSIEERVKANDELAAVLLKQNEAEKATVQARINTLLQEQKLKGKSVELSNQIYELQTEMLAIDAKVAGFESEQQTNKNSLLREEVDLKNELNLIGKTEREKEIAEATSEYEAKKLLIEQQIIDETERKSYLELLEQEHLANLQTIKAEAVNEEIELEEKRLQAKLTALNQVQAIFGAESAMGKAALIAKQALAAKELLIDLGVIKSKASKAVVTANLDAAESGSSVSTGLAKTLKLGFPAAIPALIGYAAAAAGIISTVLSATKKTKSVASSMGGTGGGSGGGGSAPSLPSAPPAFNVVGASDTNQLADAIGSQTKEPVKAYVVSNDVTTAQSMDRNIVDGASI